MEITRRDLMRLYYRQVEVTLRLPAGAWLALAILISTMILIVGVTAIAGRGAPPQHIFATIAPPITGQSLIEGLKHIYDCHDDGAGWSSEARYSYFSPSQQCTYSPTSGTFSRIQFAISNARIRGVSIHVRENTLTIGDLFLVWGVPVIRANGHLVNLRWPGRSVTAFTKSGRFSFFVPISHIWLTEGK
jgi:hypothetical protein